MSGCCEKLEICVAGKTYFADVMTNIQGAFVSGRYLDENLATQQLVAGGFAFGACSVLPYDVKRFTQPLVAGNNVITHNFGSAPVEVEVRNPTTGAEISVRVIAESATTVTIFVPVAIASARISIDA